MEHRDMQEYAEKAKLSVDKPQEIITCILSFWGQVPRA